MSNFLNPHHRRGPNFAASALHQPHDYSPVDITAVICVKLTQHNPWILERLRLIKDYYVPSPVFLVVDFGSAAPEAKSLQYLCENHLGMRYIYISDNGTFSLAAARNSGAMSATTDLLFFTDVDFLSSSSLFADLSAYATTHEFSIVRDIMLTFPAYHLTESATRTFLALDSSRRDAYLEQLARSARQHAFGDSVLFIAPYSNIFLCTKDFFSLCGGYDTDFRGHGSEDFEFLVRSSLYSNQIPLPQNVEANWYGPTKSSFFHPRPYAGFRRLCEALSFTAETSGFKCFHLWHPSAKEDPWRVNNDWKRDRLKASLRRYTNRYSKLVDIDFLPREKSALCICKNAHHAGYFFPFRLLGYKLKGLHGDSAQEIDHAMGLVTSGQVDKLCIFNPYMTSHSCYVPLVETARSLGVEVVVVERGALPSTVYYASDVSYNDPEFESLSLEALEIDTAALSAAKCLIEDIKTGSWTLEALNSYNTTCELFAIPARNRATTVFLPLQLHDDMAVTRFTAFTQSYAEFVASINRVASAHPDICFVVKNHPLSHNPFRSSIPNIKAVENNENIHALLDNVDAVICYNSGVGLLALIHGKPLVTIGNAFYNVANTGHRADSLDEAIKLVRSGPPKAADPVNVQRLLAWLISRKYSFFAAQDSVTRFDKRNSHGYSNIMITHFVYGRTSMPLARAHSRGYTAARSYLNARLGLGYGFPKPRASLRLLKAIMAPLKRTAATFGRWRHRTFAQQRPSPIDV